MAYVPLAKLHELHDGFRQPVRLGRLDLLLVQIGERLLLLHNQCPHQQARLDKATISADTLRCPVHGIEFSLSSGEAINAPQCQGRLVAYPLAYEGNTVGVDIP